MAVVVIERTARAWSRWNATRLMIEETIEHSAIPPSGQWDETDEGLRYIGSAAACEAIAVAVTRLGLDVDVRDR